MAAQSKLLPKRLFPSNVRTRPPILVLIACILILRSRLFNGPREALASIRATGSRRKLSKEELAKALQQIYVETRDGTKELLVPFRENITKVISPLNNCSLENSSGPLAEES